MQNITSSIRRSGLQHMSQFWVDLLLANDCEPEEALDNITREARTLFKVPIAMINIATSDEIIFKSCVGEIQGNRLDRSGAFCGQAVSQDEAFMVPNTRLNKRYKTSPLVIGPKQIKSYMGKSLGAPDGTRLGTLCLLDTRIHHYTKLEQRIFLDLSKRAEEQLFIVLRLLISRNSTIVANIN
jgi:GAF domain-containing protein